MSGIFWGALTITAIRDMKAEQSHSDKKPTLDPDSAELVAHLAWLKNE